MTKTIIYRYLGTNGVVETPVHIEGAYFVRMVQLTADEGKILTNGKVSKTTVRVPEGEESLWNEVALQGQK